MSNNNKQQRPKTIRVRIVPVETDYPEEIRHMYGRAIIEPDDLGVDDDDPVESMHWPTRPAS